VILNESKPVDVDAQCFYEASPSSHDHDTTQDAEVPRQPEPPIPSEPSLTGEEPILELSSTSIVLTRAALDSLISPRLGWNEYVANLSTHAPHGSPCAPWIFALHEIPVEYLLDMFPLLTQPNAFQMGNSQALVVPASASTTPLLNIFFPRLVAQSRAAVVHASQVAETAHLVCHTGTELRGCSTYRAAL
jgi:hypothetical protein